MHWEGGKVLIFKKLEIKIVFLYQNMREIAAVADPKMAQQGGK